MTPSLQRSHTPKGRAAREKILRVAERLLAARGFHGTSMRDVADAADVPLASALYHFARKEQLHGAVLATIGEELHRRLAAAIAAAPDYETTFDAALSALVDWCVERPRRVTLLLREVLDNPTRVARASKLPLAPVLRTMSAIVEEGIRTKRLRTRAAPEIAVLHVVGAISYLVAAKPTIDRIVGEARARELAEAYPLEALAFARRALGADW